MAALAISYGESFEEVRHKLAMNLPRKLREGFIQELDTKFPWRLFRPDLLELQYVYLIWLRWILQSKLRRYPRNTKSLGSDSDVNFTMTVSVNGGVYVFVGSNIIHVEKSLSVHQDEACWLPEVANITVYLAERDSVDRVLSVLALAESLQQHLIQTAEGSDKPRSNSAPAINSSDEKQHIPAAQKLANEDSEHHSNPNPCVAERGNSEKKKRPTIWFVAAGAPNHATGDRGVFTNLEDVNSDLCVHAADGTPLPVCGRGNVMGTVTLYDVWYVPGLDVNLVSVGQLAELDYSVEFARGSCTICNAADRVIGKARAREDGMYELEYLDVSLR